MKKFKEHPKPFSKKEWEFWEDRLGFFIQEFDDNIGSVARSNIEADEGDIHDHFLAGMAQGMWAVHTFIETRMVKDENEKSKKKSIITKTEPKRRYIKSGKYKKKKNIEPKIVVHKEIRHRSSVLSSKEVMGILKRFYNTHDKRKRLPVDQVLHLAIKEGRLPGNVITKKAKKVLADRFFHLVKKGLVISFKKGRKNYYKLP